MYPESAAPQPEPGENAPAKIDSPLVEIATLVRLKRGNRGLRETTNEIGGGISPSTLSRLEQGKEVDRLWLGIVCNWLNIPFPAKIQP